MLSSIGIAQQNQKYKFTLEQAVDFALDSNYTAINARRDIAIAIKKKWETTAAGLPQLDGNITYQNNLKQPTTLLPGEIAGGDPGTFVPVVFGTKENASVGATLTRCFLECDPSLYPYASRRTRYVGGISLDL